MRVFLVILIFGAMNIHSSSAQDTTATQQSKLAKLLLKKAAPPKKGDLYFIAAPTISYNPTYGFMYGIGGTASLFMGEPKTTSISSFSLGITYTTKQQLLLKVRSSLYTPNNDWILNGDWRYLDSSQPTYGLGTGPASSKLASNGFEISDGFFSKPIDDVQLMKFTQIKFHQSVYRQVIKDFFVGFGYHLDIFKNIKDQLLDTVAMPPVITSIYAYNAKYGFKQTENTLSGISLDVLFDSRDNQNNAYEGQYANVVFHINPEFLGSDQTSTSLWLEYRKYLDLTKNHHNMLCFWLFGNFSTSGNLPPLDLPAIGEDQYGKSGRGYTQGRFRGQELIYGEAEYRLHLLGIKEMPDLLGMVFFVNAFTATNRDADITLFKYVNGAIGTGIRFMFNKNSRSNLGVDFSWGNYGSGGIYFRLNETF